MESAFQMFQKSLETAISEALDNTNRSLTKSFILRKKVRDLFQGDIVVPAGCLKLNSSEHDKLISLMREYCDSSETLTTEVSSDKFNLLSFFIDRPMMCGLIIKEVLARGSSYGKYDKQQDTDQVISLHTEILKRATSLVDLRLAVVQHHAVKLLEANGFTVQHTTQLRNADYEQMVQKFSEQASVNERTSEAMNEPWDCTDTDLESFSCTRHQVLSRLSPPSSRADTHSDNSKDTGGSESPNAEERNDLRDILKHESERNISIDLQSVISSQKLHMGKGGFDANLRDVQVLKDHQPTEVLEDSLRILHNVSNSTQTSKHHCLHVIPHNQAFYDQQVALIALSLAEKSLTQSQVVVGPVQVQGASQSYPVSSEDFYKSRLSQFKEASEMRSVISSDGCSEDDVKTLCDASIKIDILGNACNNPLTLENTASGRGAESRLGAFILYNTARLSTLLHRFEQAVEEGVYPALPKVDLIDWALLREEEDWELVYVYLAAFPDVVSQSVECVVPTDGKISAKIHTHKVTNFLVSFCKCLSAHYSRYHILTGRESHLLPLMYARLYMMRAAHQVLLNSLHLLGIQALSYV